MNEVNWFILGVLVFGCIGYVILERWEYREKKKAHERYLKHVMGEKEYHQWLRKHAMGSAPCKGGNSNICVAEGCYGYSCLTMQNKKLASRIDDLEGEK